MKDNERREAEDVIANAEKTLDQLQVMVDKLTQFTSEIESLLNGVVDGGN